MKRKLRHIFPLSLMLTIGIITSPALNAQHDRDHGRDHRDDKGDRNEYREDRHERQEYREERRDNRREYTNDRREVNRDRREGRAERRDARAPHWHYAGLPRHGAIVSYVPRSAVRVFHEGNWYYFNNGVYYRPYYRSFLIVPPPVGLRVNFLPAEHIRVFVGGHMYFYYYGTFYDLWRGQYVVVRPPIGAVVESIPDGYQTFYDHGDPFYVVDDIQYRPFFRDDKVWFEVVAYNR